MRASPAPAATAPPPLDFARRERERAAMRIGIGRVLLGAGLIVLWQILAVVLGPDVVADLRAIGARLWEMAHSGALLRDVGATLWESAAGLIIGGVLGLALAFALRMSPRLEKACEPFIGAAMGIPKLALAPLIILWFGVGLGSKIAFVASVVFFLVFFATVAGIRGTDPRLVVMARIAGAGRRLLVREVLLPSALPMILSSLKVAGPRAISAAVVGEFMAAEVGIGHAIRYAMDQSDTVGIYAGIVVVTAMVVALDAALERWQRHALRWRRGGPAGF
ncbi:MAG: ABC transporter permease [Burkholderiales bacterium]|nr:ABC transporter permease [Burkholderiales bacterium]